MNDSVPPSYFVIIISNGSSPKKSSCSETRTCPPFFKITALPPFIMRQGRGDRGLLDFRTNECACGHRDLEVELVGLKDDLANEFGRINKMS